MRLEQLPVPNKKVPTYPQAQREKLYKAFGYTYEDINDAILTMARTGSEKITSMGTDIPLAVLSEKHQPLFNYFKQLFAQVTNPPLMPCGRRSSPTPPSTSAPTATSSRKRRKTAGCWRFTTPSSPPWS